MTIGWKGALLTLALVCLVCAAPAAADHPRIDLETATVAEVQDLMGSGRLTSEDLTRRYLDRIDALNQRGPSLNAVRRLNPAALAEARARDAERAAGNV